MRGSGICVLATGRQTVRVVTRAILLAAVAVLAACTQESAERDTTAVSADAKTVGRCSDATITDDRVGAVRVGMSVDSLRQECPIIRDTTEMAEGEPGRVIDVLKFRAWATPFVWIGSNAILLYMLAELDLIKVVATRLVGGEHHDPFGKAQTLVVSVASLTLLIALARYLYRRGVFVRV